MPITSLSFDGLHQLKLDTARRIPFGRESYQDRYLERSNLVSPTYIRTLLQEALGVDKSEPEAPFTPLEPISLATEPSKVMWDWYSVGAACAIGGFAIALLTVNRQQLKTQLQRQLFPN